MEAPEERTIVIVGGVAGGASAATRARRCNEKARIILIEKDRHVSFANCGLPYYVGEEIAERSKILVTTPELLRKRFRIEVRTMEEVVEINRESKTVVVRRLESGTTYEEHYDRLILAPGAKPIVPPVHGAHAENVFTVRNLEDADRIKDFIRSAAPARAVVVGAGFIGLEMVEQLRNLGLETELVELATQVLPPLDPEMAHLVEEEIVKHGVKVRTGNGLKGFRVEEDRVTAVELDDGGTLETDFVVLGIGVRPNTQLAEQAGLELGNHGGIQVDEFMRTNDPDIYAVGDAAEYMHGVLRQAMLVPLAGPANRAGRIAGEHAATDSAEPMRPVLGTAVVRVFGKTAAMTGLSDKAAEKLSSPHRSVVVPGNHHAGYYPGAEGMVLKLTYDPHTGRILGAQAVGGAGVDKRIDVIATAIHFGASVYDLAGLDLAYAPPFGSAKDPVHIAAFVACNDLDGMSPVISPWKELDGEQVVDVRTPRETEQGKIPGCRTIPVDDLRERLDELDPSLPTVTVCHGGQRAHIAARILRQNGFERVHNLTGGMSLWKHAHPDAPLEKKS